MQKFVDNNIEKKSIPGRFKVLDCWINRLDMLHAAQLVRDRIASGGGGYVCFSNVHTVVTACKDNRLREITDNSFLSVPDGKPLSLVGKMQGLRDVGQVAGPDFMPYFFEEAKGVRHFFYGSTPDTLEKLTRNFKQKFPGASIVGSYSPPFRALTVTEEEEILAIIKLAKPDVIWVGLGAPKQEYWMADQWERLQPAILMGVGAAFDFHAGKIARAPEWMRKMSVEWLYRLCQEPRRLWKRYLVTNSLFFYYLMKSAVVARFSIWNKN